MIKEIDPMITFAATDQFWRRMRRDISTIIDDTSRY